MIALAVFALSRIPFFFSNPDWGRFLPEHCFLLSAPAIQETRVAFDPDGDNPFWLTNPEQIAHHYHAGSGWISHAVRWTTALLGTRSLLALKFLATAIAAAYLALLVPLLLRVWPHRRDRFVVLATLFASVFPPVLLLWYTLLPFGHYSETHLVYVLMVPFMVAASSSRLSLPWAAVAGVIGGLATAYTISNAVFVVVLVLVCLMGGRASGVRTGLARRLGSCALAGVLSLAAFGVAARPQAVFDRLEMAAQGQAGNDENSLGEELSYGQWFTDGHAWDALGAHVELLYSPTPQLYVPADGPIDWTREIVGWVAAGVLSVWAAAVALFLAWQAARYIRRWRRGGLSSAQRFLGINGLLLLAFIAGYGAVDPYLTRYDTKVYIWYLTPTFVPLFVGSAAMLHGMRRSASRFQRVAGHGAAGLLAVVLVAGYLHSLVFNSRPLERPEYGSCDTMLLDGYFTEALPTSAFELPTYSLDRDAGILRCQSAAPGNDEACLYRGHMVDFGDVHTRQRCLDYHDSRGPPCAQAFGAMRYNIEVCLDGTSHEDICHEFTGDLREACISGAFQGVGRTWSDDTCHPELITHCTSSFEDPAALSGCFEQAAALLVGMPLLPPAPAVVPDACADWPVPWLGLCERAANLAQGAATEPGKPACEEVYLERYAEAIPEAGDLAYREALTYMPGKYPWYAIGIARSRGEVDCRWTGEFRAEDDFFLGRAWMAGR